MIVPPNDRGQWWSSTDPCFMCQDDIAEDQTAVLWSGRGKIVMHPACAARLGTHLIADSREAALANGDGYWRGRATRVAKTVMESREFKAEEQG